MSETPQPEETPAAQPGASAPPPAGPPAPPPAAPPPGYAPPPTWPPQAPPPAGYAPPPPGYAAPAPAPYPYTPAPPTSSNAIIGLVLAIVSWVVCPVIPAIVALVLARSSTQEIARSGGAVGGAGLNTATRVISWINIGVYAALIVGFGIFFLIIAIAGAASSR